MVSASRAILPPHCRNRRAALHQHATAVTAGDRSGAAGAAPAGGSQRRQALPGCLPLRPRHRQRRLGLLDFLAGEQVALSDPLLTLQRGRRHRLYAPEDRRRDPVWIDDATLAVIDGRDGIDNWNFYLVFSLFRLAAIIQGIVKRAQIGTASSADAEEEPPNSKQLNLRSLHFRRFSLRSKGISASSPRSRPS